MKQIIRDKIKASLKAYPAEAMKNAANSLVMQLKPLLDKAHNIAIYHADGYELNLGNVIEYSISQGKQLYQPFSYKNLKHMLLIEYDADYRAIFSPDGSVPEHCYEWYNLDLILLPLIAVDRHGFRLGRGGGYYDTTLMDIMRNALRPILCGIGFDSQLLRNIPRDDWDIRLDYFASEQQLLKF